MKKTLFVIVIFSLVCSLSLNGQALTSKEQLIANEVERGINALPPQKDFIPTAHERTDEQKVLNRVGKKYGVSAQEAQDIYTKALYESFQREK